QAARRLVLLSLVLICATSVVYWPVLSHPFADYDDDNYVTANPNVQAGLGLKSMRWALIATEKSNWHPLTWISHQLDCELYGLNPAGHHFTNLTLHVVNVLLVFLLLALATRSPARSFLVALLFAIHPVNVESVAWIAERKNVLSTTFFLLAIAAYGWYVRRPSLKRYASLAAMFVLGLASKPMVVTLPFVLLLLDYWPLQRISGVTKPPSVYPVPQVRFSRLLLEKLPLLVLSAASSAVTIYAQRTGGSIKSLTQVPLAVRVKNAIWAYAQYLWKTVWPVKLAPHYPHPGNALPLWQVLLEVALLTAFSLVVWRRRSSAFLLVGWCWFLGTLIPVIGLVQVGNQAIADRYAYLPLLGLFVVPVWGICDLAQYKRVGSAARIITPSLVFCALSFLAYRQIGFWQNNYELWSHTLEVTKNNALAENNLGVALVNLGRDEEALAHFHHAEEIDPSDPTSHVNIAAFLQSHGKPEPAMTEYSNAIHLATGNATAVANSKVLAIAFENLGTLYSEAGNYEKARENYRQALRINPIMVGQLIDMFYHAVSTQPDGPTYLSLAEMLEQSGRREDARAAYQQALRFDSTRAEAQRELNSLPSD
ncbi:MAG TPA: tetratricopeptide repeat protein, partial [Terriglobales bacterium]|nr:tetratricopeptide repeat protein [Terriglobales bacterium]